MRNPIDILKQVVGGIGLAAANTDHFFFRRMMMEQSILNNTSPGVTSKRYCDHEFIVSLTSYGRRMRDVCYAIESLMCQTMKANRIILNVDKEYESRPLPMAIQKQISRGLEIAIVDDLRSYKKLIPTLEANPEAVIITVDDDIIYDFDILESLILSYLAHPHRIHACRTHVMTLGKQGQLLPYKQWKWLSSETDNPKLLFPTSGGGTLYPPIRCTHMCLIDSHLWSFVRLRTMSGSRRCHCFRARK